MKRYRLLLILIGIIGAVLGFLYIIGARSYEKEQANQLNEKLEETQSLDDYFHVYQNEYVRYLRQALDAYLANDPSQACIIQGAVAQQAREGITAGLDAFDKNYYKSKFVVLTFDNFENNEELGKSIQILFQDKPDRIFFAWVGNNDEGEICLLGFLSNDDQDPQQLKEATEFYEGLIYSKEYSL